MKENVKAAKQEMKVKSRPYQVYSYYMALPIAYISLFVLPFLGIELSNIGFILLAITILAHIGASKLKLVSKKKYVAPILIYVINVLSILLVVPMLMANLNGESVEIVFGLFALILIPIEIVAIVFFFLTAKDIKKAYPTMKQDAKEARSTYMAIKKAA